MNPEPIKPYPHQVALMQKAIAHKFTCAYGVSRGGKTFSFIYMIVQRALMADGSKHAVIRATASSVKSTVWDTAKEVLERLAPGYSDQIDTNLTDRVVRLHNGSEIWFFGAQDHAAVNRLMGAEFATILLNEGTDLTHAKYSKILTRLRSPWKLNNGLPLVTRLYLDCNPTTEASWVWKLFIGKVNPSTGNPLKRADQYCDFAFDQDSNPDIESEYYEDLEDSADEEQVTSKVLGVWAKDNPYALFNAEHIGRDPGPAIEDYERIVVAVDHAVKDTDKSDETGIIVAGLFENKFYILEDCTMKAAPLVWAQKLIDLYYDYNADCLLTETNQGGDLLDVPFTVLPRGNMVNIKPQHADRRTGGKVARAKGPSVLYRKGLVYHTDRFKELERQMVEFDSPGYRGKDDRVDALVYALNELASDRPVHNGGSGLIIPGFWG